LIAVAVFIIAYAILSEYSNSTPNAKGLGAAQSLAPIVLIGLVLVLRWTRPLIALLVAVGIGASLYRFWPFLKQNYEWADLLQQCGAYGLVAASFGRSLLAGRTPMCTQLADKLHGPLSPVEIGYTRRATIAWTIFYALITAAILVLFFTASLHIWSLFVNFATFGLIGLMFLADHAIRRRVLPHRPGRSLLAALRQSLLGS
jgi:uncharacterized membrane protein